MTRDASGRGDHLLRATSPARNGRTRALGLILLVSVTAAVIGYRDQIWTWYTHRKGAPAVTAVYEALPASPPPLLRLAVAGDTGEVNDALDETTEAMESIGESSPYDALLLLGDNVYPDGDPGQVQEHVFDPFAGIIDQGASLLAVLGNHDVRSGHGDAQMSALGMSGRWWSRDLGEVLIVGLDSNTPDDAAQLAFLEESLASSDEEWKIVALHHPPYSAGMHGSSEEVRHAFAPLFERYGVQLVLSGHDHDYQRSEPIAGVTYVVSGGGSRTRLTGEEGFTAESWSANHFLDVTVFDDSLVLRAVMGDGRVADVAMVVP